MLMTGKAHGSIEVTSVHSKTSKNNHSPCNISWSMQKMSNRQSECDRELEAMTLLYQNVLRFSHINNSPCGDDTSVTITDVDSLHLTCYQPLESSLPISAHVYSF